MKQIGVLVSRGYGAGWSSWGKPEMALDKELVEAFERGASDEEKGAIAKKNWPDAYVGGLFDCYIEYLDKGTLFRINEYDGYETIEVMSADNFIVTK